MMTLSFIIYLSSGCDNGSDDCSSSSVTSSMILGLFFSVIIFPQICPILQ